MEAELQQYIEAEIIPHYDGFDKAHRRDHVEKVISESLALARHYDVDESMVYTVAAYHDLGLCEGRELHHVVSGRILLADAKLRQWFSEEQLAVMAEAVEDHRASSDHAPRSIYGRILLADAKLRQWFSEEQLAVMAEAVEDHRASSDHAPRSIYGRIVAEADRVIDADVTLRRTVQYGLSHYPEMNKDEQYARFVGHLQNKYAEGGYLKLWIPESENASRLAELRKIIADKTALQKVFDRIYAEETATL